ncbi:MAG: iron-containing alcohol dehydrogenase [Desulfobacterales bacterium]|nr:iron-containing alcohol dehydrogenase [Desulfobacterales bacterium]MBL7205158.1 iron-containing alcohol dehydrogenase [Desulfobacteraceae bacterium]MBU0735644.1 iron-containing alcohol dehydrogenase [Pseudomonadota bacterium]
MKTLETIFREWKPTKIHFGEGAIRKVGEIVSKYASNVLMVTGESSIKDSGIMGRITASLQRANIPYEIVAGVEPNPSKETVYRIAYHLLAGNYTCTLAVGGGSVMDAAKAAGILATAKEGDLDDYFGVGLVSQKIDRTSTH